MNPNRDEIERERGVMWKPKAESSGRLVTKSREASRNDVGEEEELARKWPAG